MNEKKNGKKIAVVIVSTMLVASLAVVLVISAFYKYYDPTKYGRNNGGVDTTPTEQIENQDEDK